jgi:hypothetical protein
MENARDRAIRVPFVRVLHSIWFFLLQVPRLSHALDRAIQWDCDNGHRRRHRRNRRAAGNLANARHVELEGPSDRYRYCRGF